MQKAVSSLPPKPTCLTRCSSLLGHLATSVSVAEKPWDADWMLYRPVTSGIPSPSGVTGLHPLGSSSPESLPAQILPVLAAQ